MKVGEKRAVGATEIAVLAIGADGRVTLRIGPAGRCERRVTLRPGESASAGGITVSVGKGTTADEAEILLG
ncbi:MAG TPA: hypothetical protein VEJ18_00660 [Planctomycetota bacterium]|nr:hypothetical protein [Planctomycetota bacterium]